MDEHDIPDVFWEALNSLSFDGLPPGPDEVEWRPALPDADSQTQLLGPTWLDWSTSNHGCLLVIKRL